MSENDIQILRGEIAILKAVMDEKWTSHDKRSDERWVDLMEQFHEMVKKFESRPCQLHGEMMATMYERQKMQEARTDGMVAKMWAVMLAVIAALIASVFDVFKKR